jgi:hypothetical protein
MRHIKWKVYSILEHTYFSNATPCTSTALMFIYCQCSCGVGQLNLQIPQVHEWQLASWEGLCSYNSIGAKLLRLQSDTTFPFIIIIHHIKNVPSEHLSSYNLWYYDDKFLRKYTKFDTFCKGGFTGKICPTITQNPPLSKFDETQQFWTWNVGGQTNTIS